LADPGLRGRLHCFGGHGTEIAAQPKSLKRQAATFGCGVFACSLPVSGLSRATK
jgi:hypothetical protein